MLQPTATPGFTSRSACPVCAGTDTHRIYTARYDEDPVRALVQSNFGRQGVIDWSLLAGVPFEVDKCATCDLLFQVQTPNDAMLEVIYTQMISPGFLDEYERGLLTLDEFHRIAGEFTVLFERIGKHPADITMLDFGVGQGRWARVARGMGATVYVTEIGDDKKQLARTLGLEVIEDEDVDRMTFDLVHTEQVLEHLVHPGRDFARLARAVAAGGLFKAAIPYRGKLEQLLKSKGLPTEAMFASGGAKAIPGEVEAFASIQPLEHLNAFSEKTIDWLAAHNGLRKVSEVRRRSISVQTGDAQGLVRGAKKVGIELVKAAMKPKIGYHVLERA
ncbi:Methyltransferase domain-containing protein [Sphingomonas sp. OV641]|uniref:class I SAM-dependent methyltransferase n=1 Tax=Sphingomonas sp. OV641 TaxID=1881068 RepID=UPI0008B83DBD|nr:class I SAM-dependent methyltransferase [Sphingomonas sp. OV641]SEJ31940.1 Methyltransferase domain-containing protein [Sphingomonas sp. OV641]